jgi:hypothetical protein
VPVGVGEGPLAAGAGTLVVGAPAGEGVGAAVGAGLGAPVGQVVGVGERGPGRLVVVCGRGVVVFVVCSGVRVLGVGVLAAGVGVEEVVAAVAGGRTMR